MTRQLAAVVLVVVAGCAPSLPPPARALLADLRARSARVEASTDDRYSDPDVETLDVRPLIGLTRDQIGEALGVRFVDFHVEEHLPPGVSQPDGSDRQVGFSRLPEGWRGGGVTLLLHFDGVSGSNRCTAATWGHTK